MERLLLASVVMGVIAVPQAVLPPPEPGIEILESVNISIFTNIPFDNRTVEEEAEIRNYSSLIGSVKEVKAKNHFGHLDYSISFSASDCVRAQLWTREIVRASEPVVAGFVRCPQIMFFTTKDAIVDARYNLQ
ncbi:hypothetical protein V3C99_016782 [Haemonchus contortus]